MNGDVPADEPCLDCEFCLEFDTGPIQTRTRAYEVGEGHAIEPGDWPYEPVIQLDDGWLATWDRRGDDSGPPYLICPYHARGERVPRSPEVAMIGDVAVDLQEFDYIGTRPPDIVMFKHIATRRYLNLAERNGHVVWCDHSSETGVVERDVDEGFRQARASA